MKRLFYLLLLSIMFSSSFAQEFKTVEKERNSNIRLLKKIGDNEIVILSEKYGYVVMTKISIFEKYYNEDEKRKFKKINFLLCDKKLTALKTESFNPTFAKLLDKGKCYIYDTNNCKIVKKIRRKKWKFRMGPRDGAGGRSYYINELQIEARTDYRI